MVGPGGDGTVINNGPAGTATNKGGSVTITYNNSQAIETGEEIACASPTSFRNNNLFIEFDLAGDFGITDAFEVSDAEIGIGPVISPAGFPLTLNVYSSNGGAFPGGTQTLQGTATVTITTADAETIISVPLSATIPAGDNIVYEAVLVDDGTDTNFTRFAANQQGPSGINFIQAADCGAATPTNFSTLGLTQVLIMNLVGEEVLGVEDNINNIASVYPNPAGDILNVKIPSNITVNEAKLYDILGKDTGLRLVNGTFDTSSLAKGIYMLNVKTSAGTLVDKIVKK
ncbi:T9SS type A sorting domain-containing protein [Altibacter sp.]|nr:T9SS type A sorting domain-containing protein [Altibacter sp.]